MEFRLLIALAVVSLVGCRADLGEPDYSAQESFDVAEVNEESLPGPDPFVPGELRLSLGKFYEGQATQVLPIDQVDYNFWVYNDEFNEDPACVVSGDSERVEGKLSDRIEHQGLGWWGLGFHYYSDVDLSDWTTLKMSVRSSDPAFDSIRLEMGSGVSLVAAEAPDEPDEVVEPERLLEASGMVKLEDYGYANDGKWHHLSIPLADYAKQGVDLGRLASPFILVGGGGDAGEVAWLDAVYFTAD
jgi:hypothetical protein